MLDLSRGDDELMYQALREAEIAFAENEVPIGAVIAHGGRIVGRGRNACERLQDATAHAEILAIGAASAALETWRLEGCTLYATLEPCPMCMGACLNARLDRVVFGAAEPKAGACGSILDLRAPPGYNHRLEVTGGLAADRCSELMREFFRTRRRRQEP